MTTIISYQKCNCGAITISFDNGADISMYQKTLKNLNIDLSKAEKLPQSYCCNHCVNHWDINLCECGSGEPVGQCSCGSHSAMQQFGEVFDSFQKIVQNFCNYGY